MRISDIQKRAILESVKKELGEDAKVFLFGSRVDDKKKGGDIDLLVETSSDVEEKVRKKLRILSRIQRKIGEQKIDLIITYPHEYKKNNLPLILKNARSKGIQL